MRHGPPITFLFILLGATLLLDVYVYSVLKTLTKNWRAGKIVKWSYLVFSLGITILFLAGLPSFRSATGMRPYHEWILSLFLALLVTKLFFCIVLFFGDIVRGIMAGINVLRRRHTGPALPSRRRFIGELAT